MSEPPSFEELCAARLAVIVAHPDDEVIGCGGLIAKAAEATVIHATDGAPRDGRDAAAAGFAGWPDYAAARRREAEAALMLAGLPPGRVLAWNVPDQQASLALAALARSVCRHVRQFAPATIVSHAYEGGHPDHDAVAFAVHAGCRLLAREGLPPPQLIEMTLYHADGAPFVADRFIPHRDAGPALEIELDRKAQELKRRMVACHATQLAILARFAIGRERFRRAPSYDFTLPPHLGALHYERHDWGMTGPRWRELAAAALAELHLCA